MAKHWEKSGEAETAETTKRVREKSHVCPPGGDMICKLGVIAEKWEGAHYHWFYACIP